MLFVMNCSLSICNYDCLTSEGHTGHVYESVTSNSVVFYDGTSYQR